MASRRKQKDQRKRERLAIKQQAQACVQYYEARKGDPRFEPAWIHPLFAPAYEVAEGRGDSEDRQMVQDAYSAITTPDGEYDFYPFGKRVLQEGIKVGTTSWVFFGRKHITPVEHRNWVICWRSFGDFTAYIAYQRDRPMGLSAMTGDEIGPCRNLVETMHVIDSVESEY